MIYVQSKDDGKYIQFQQVYKCNLYYMDISEANLDKHCYFNTVKEGKTIFSILDQKKQKPLEPFKKDVASHQTKTSSTHWNVTPLKEWTLIDEMLTQPTKYMAIVKEL